MRSLLIHDVVMSWHFLKELFQATRRAPAREEKISRNG